MRISDWSSDVCSSDLADGGVARRVEHHQRLPEAADGGFQAVRGDVLEELLLDAEGPSDKEHLRLARRLDLCPRVGEVRGHMRRHGRRGAGLIGSTSCRASVGKYVSYSVVAGYLK